MKLLLLRGLKLTCIFLDVNECNFNPDLCKNGQCINNDGSYRCQCYAGYVLDDTGRNCRGRKMAALRPLSTNSISTRMYFRSIFIQSQCSKFYFNEMQALVASLQVGFAITGNELL